MGAPTSRSPLARSPGVAVGVPHEPPSPAARASSGIVNRQSPKTLLVSDVDAPADGVVHPRPDARAEQDRQPEPEQPDAVPLVVGVQVPRAAPKAARANPTALATSIQPAARTWYSHFARMTTGSWLEGRRPLARRPPLSAPARARPLFPERTVPPPPAPRPPRPLPDRAALLPPERAFRPVPVPEREPRPPPVPARPVAPLPRERPVPRPEPPLPAGRAPPGGRLGSITSSGSSLTNSSRAAAGCPPRERAEPLGARVAMMTNVTRTSPLPEAPIPGVSS